MEKDTEVSTSYNGVDNLEVMECAENYNRYILSLIKRDIHSKKKILDFGAGAGTFAKMLAYENILVDCYEIDKSLQQKIIENKLTLVNHLNESKYDFIYSLNVLEHIKDDENAIKEIFHLLNPGGELFLYLPAFNLLYSSMDKKVGHYRRYNASTLRKILQDNGFEIVKMRYVDSLGYLATLVYKLIGSSQGDINEGQVKFYDRWLFPLSLVLDRFLGRLLGKNIVVYCKKL